MPHPFLTQRFIGPRFDDHGLDVDVLPELVKRKEILVETAKAWKIRLIAEDFHRLRFEEEEM